MLRFFTQYQEIYPQAWDALAERSTRATWFQTREAYGFYSSLPQEMIPFVFGAEENGVLVGIAAGYITRERNAIRQFFTRRAIILGGVLLDEYISDETLSLLLTTIRKQLGTKAIYIELRNLHDYSHWKAVFAAQGFDYVPHLNFQVNCTDKTAVLAHMKSNRRRQIRKGFAHGAYIAEAQSESDVTAFYAILRDLYRHKVKTPLPSIEFFLRLYHKQYATFLLVKYQNSIIGGIVCPVLQGRALYEWYICGLDKQYRQQYPSVLATYAAIEYAATHGIASFDFMGAGTPDTPYGVRTFKSRFGGTEVENGRFLLVCKPLLYRIGQLAVHILHTRD